ncbi:MAG: lipopolysaccharide biosynthesis protein [Hyphomicrobium sp.]|nr:lipopolysaccharide biosynthesis protein [Hyphomicrobium sp.]
MPAKATASPDDIELSSVFGALKKSFRRQLVISGLLFGLTYATLMMIAPKYQSEVALAIVARNASSNFTDSKSSNSSIDSITTKMDKEAINTHVRALRATELLEKVAEQMSLKDKPEFNAELGPIDQIDMLLRLVGIGGPRSGESERDRVLNTLRNQLEVYSAKESRFIGVRMTSIDPELAAKIANGVADTYRTRLANDSIVEVDEQQEVIQGKITKLMPELAAIETEVDRYRREIDSYRGGAQNVGLNEQQMSELTAELVKAKGTRGEAEARAKSAKEMMKLGSADALPDVQKSPLIQNLVQQRVRIERQISELSASLLPGHPRMQQLNADLAGLKRQLTGEINKLVDSLEKEARVAQGREDSIKKSLDDIKSKVVTNAPEEAKLRQLEANAKAKRTELESLQAQLEGNRKKLDTRVAPVEVKVISEAQAASVPVFPKKASMSALVAVASLIFGTAWTVLRSLFTGARSGGSATTSIGSRVPSAANRAEPVLAGAPLAAEARTAGAKAPPVTPISPTASLGTETVMANLVRRLALKRPAEGGHRTLITGEGPLIEPGAEAIELAKALAEQRATVVLVDWSPSGHGIASLAGVSNKRGLTELLLGEISFDEAVNRLPTSTVHFIGCGASLDSAAGDIDPDQLNLVLDALDEAYDHIIVTGGHEDARFLFEAIQGRFDAGVIVAEGKKRASVLEDPAGSFLGFEVSDIDVIRFEREKLPQAVSQRIMRATQRGGGEARPVN